MVSAIVDTCGRDRGSGAHGPGPPALHAVLRRPAVGRGLGGAPGTRSAPAGLARTRGRRFLALHAISCRLGNTARRCFEMPIHRPGADGRTDGSLIVCESRFLSAYICVHPRPFAVSSLFWGSSGSRLDVPRGGDVSESNPGEVGGGDPGRLWTAVGDVDLWKGGWCEVQTCSVVVEATYRHVSVTEALPQLHSA